MSLRGIRARAAVSLLGLALPLASAAPVAAHSFTADSTITIHYQDGRFFGSVRSERERCERRGRNVKLIKVRPGADKVVGSTETNRNSRWSIRKPNADGRYYAKVTKRRNSRYGHNHVCKGDRSRTIRV
jgi:hypothetical protein